MASKYKFDDLAEIAKANGIDPTKQGKTKRVNKLKGDLYKEIKQKLGRSPKPSDIPKDRASLDDLIKQRAAKKKAASPRSPAKKKKSPPKKLKGGPTNERLRKVEEMMDNPIELLIMGDARILHALNVFKDFNMVGGASTYGWLMVASDSDIRGYPHFYENLGFPYLSDDEFKAKIKQFPEVKQFAFQTCVTTSSRRSSSRRCPVARWCGRSTT